MATWGLNTVALKVLVSHFAPITMTAFRIFFAGVVVLLTLQVMKKLRLPTKEEWLFLIVISAVHVFLHHALLATGLTATTASNTGMIQGLVPVFTAILAIFFLGDKATLVRTIGFILGFSGVAFIVMSGSGPLGKASYGDLLVLLGFFCQAAGIILIKKRAAKLDPRLMTGYMFVIGALFLFLTGLIKEPEGIASLSGGSAFVWFIFIISAIFGTAIGHLIYNHIIGKIGAAEAGIFINFIPFFTLIGAVLFLNESIGWAQIMGFILILIGVMLGSGTIEVKRRQHRLVEKSHYNG